MTAEPDIPIDTDVAIVGAGLCGLAIAEALTATGRDVTVLDARDRVGGRIVSLPAEVHGTARYDLGPAWIWPHNTRMLRLIGRLGLEVFEQHAEGRLAFQDRNGAVRRDLDMATMAGSLRVKGGLALVPERMAASLPAATLRLGHRIDAVEAEGGALRLTGSGPGGTVVLRAQQVVLALPPRIAAQIILTPAPRGEVGDRLAATPTWMAGQAKLVAVYETAFWRKDGLSGDAISHRGPLVEIHDASAEAVPAGEAALFGFVHPAWQRAGRDREELKAAATDQLAALFGPAAAAPRKMLVQDWSGEPFTATAADRTPPPGHPVYRPIEILSAPWAGRLHLAGSETAAANGGFLEGALESAETALRVIGARVLA